ncbi:glycosyltransferase [Roseomonas fluvialis]|uniref:Glycosyltransferase subfamily 4-like N-terminal domain-containing protein n=1 Tax=Roseomonas fluvialis TaxID=1750527 RepID=A0ABN6P754_9PROT|nr:glycosyltransferase [Roseomonas fluvialis]BDG73474.1 hypothetical protein Rmf_34030 [Roseomonas fluvialis]
MGRIGIDAHVLDGKYQGSRSWLENVLDHIPATAGAAAHEWVIYSADPTATARRFPWPRYRHALITTQDSIARLMVFWPTARRRDRLDALVTQYVSPPLVGPRFRQVVVIHDVLFESDPQFFPKAMRWRLRLLCRLSAARAAVVLTVSRHAAGEIAHRYGVPEDRILLAPNAPGALPAPSADDFAAAGGLAPFLLWVGRLEPRKNLPLALAATQAARGAGARLVVVGREDHGPAGAAMAAQLAQTPGVVHLRDVAPPRLAALYATAAALVFPSLGEGFGIPVIEALSVGTAVIASNRGAIPEAGGRLARYIDPAAPDAAAQMAALVAQALAGGLRPDPAACAAHLAAFHPRRAAEAVVAAVR